MRIFSSPGVRLSPPPAHPTVVSIPDPMTPFDSTTDAFQLLQPFRPPPDPQRAVAASFEELYRRVEDACSHKLADSLYQKLRAAMKARAIAQLKALRSRSCPDPIAFLSRVDECWSDHCASTLTTRSIFLYLDRAYCAKTPGVKGVWDLGLMLFRASLVGGDEEGGGGGGVGNASNSGVTVVEEDVGEIVRKTTRGLLASIQRERDGEAVDRARIKRLTAALVNLGLYADHFECAFLDHSAAYYRAEGTRAAQSSDAAGFLTHCEARLAEEEDRASTYLDASTRRTLTRCVEQNLVETHVIGVLDKGFDALCAENRIEDLRRLHALCARVDKVDKLRDAFAARAKRVGAAIVQDEENDKDMVQNLLDVKESLERIVSDAFGGSLELFSNALKEAFESFVNSRRNRPAELIAKYVDGKLRAGSKSGYVDEEEMERTLDAVLTLFRCVLYKRFSPFARFQHLIASPFN